MRQPSLARRGARFTGLIDTLSNGYGVVNRHPWVVLIPILLDLFLWLGPQVTVARLVSQTLSRMVGFGPRGAWGVDQAQQRDLVEAVEGYNLLAALAPSVVGVPSLVASLGVRNPLQATPLDNWGVAGAVLLGSVLGGMLLGSLYYAILAQQVRDGAVAPTRLLGLALRSWTRVLLYLLLLGGLALLFGLPIGFLAVVAAQVSPELGSLAASAAMVALVWAGIYLFFVPEAIFMSQVGPLQAVKNSVAVVRLGFWRALGIMLLITVVLLGMGRVWELAARSPWGLGLGILGNAYIASGLIAASMGFYWERIGAAGSGQPPTSSGDSGPVG